MGWYAGLSYEEMQEQFGNGTEKGLPKDSSNSPGTADGDGDGDGEAANGSTPSSSVKAAPTACPLPSPSTSGATFPPPPPPEEYESIYHLCRKQDWDDCVQHQKPYFPRTFLQDGKFTRASLYLEDIVDVANEYYQDSTVSPSTEDWIVLEVDSQFLYYGLGIPILAAIAPESKSNEIKCLQIFGGLSTHPLTLKSLIKSEYPMKRRAVDGKFVGMLQSMLSERSTTNTGATQQKQHPGSSGGKEDCGCPTTTNDKTKLGTEEKKARAEEAQEKANQPSSSASKKKKGFFRKLITSNKTTSSKQK